ncbi:uncharacterized protein PV09_06344 [Verruconis gallopava]|uniref:Uncharacterized protein n=1 Tax=Verruconis gallopava TaxID=253628 RepID=A0A0D1XIN0_9PEZI|nr:uncharacterized protein PV09_06344 [Verruconis gallopava]KIW02186.1 hypothetical protein PV09_06344 [Verruconis gallopava]
MQQLRSVVEHDVKTWSERLRKSNWGTTKRYVTNPLALEANHAVITESLREPNLPAKVPER